MTEHEAIEYLRKVCDYGRDIARLDQICAALGESPATVRSASQQPQAEICPRCDGTGASDQVYAPSTKDCVYCGGSGKLPAVR